MKIILIALSLFCIVNLASAKGSSYPSPTVTNSGGDIIIPDIATDGIRTTDVGRTSNGDLVVCPSYKNIVTKYDGGNVSTRSAIAH